MTVIGKLQVADESSGRRPFQNRLSLLNILTVTFGLVSASPEHQQAYPPRLYLCIPGQPPEVLLLGSTSASLVSPQRFCQLQVLLQPLSVTLGRPGSIWLYPCILEISDPCAGPGANIQSHCKRPSRNTHNGKAEIHTVLIANQGPASALPGPQVHTVAAR